MQINTEQTIEALDKIKTQRNKILIQIKGKEIIFRTKKEGFTVVTKLCANAPLNQSLKALVSFNDLRNAVKKSIKSFSLYVDNECIIIKPDNPSLFRIPVKILQNKPKKPKTKKTPIVQLTVSSKELKRMMECGRICPRDCLTFPNALQGVLMQVEKEALIATASDRKVLGQAYIKLNGEESDRDSNFGVDFIIPSISAAKLRDSLLLDVCEVTLSVYAKYVKFEWIRESGEYSDLSSYSVKTEIYSEFIDGIFPRYENLLNKESKNYYVEMDCEKLLDAVNSLSRFVNKGSFLLKFHFVRQVLEISYCGGYFFDSSKDKSGSVVISTEGSNVDSFTIYFNSDKIIKALNFIGSCAIIMFMGGSDRVCIIENKRKFFSGFSAVVYPISVLE